MYEYVHLNFFLIFKQNLIFFSKSPAGNKMARQQSQKKREFVFLKIEFFQILIIIISAQQQQESGDTSAKTI